MNRLTLDREIVDRAQELVEKATARGVTVATAESCTAGMVASSIAGIPGASTVLRGGAVTYCDEVKHRVLGVPCEVLKEFTAVSEPCARAMAEGARSLFDVDIVVSLTGYAGPGGGTEDDPAGTVYIGVYDRGATRCVRCSFEGDRNEVRARATLFALDELINCCSYM